MDRAVVLAKMVPLFRLSSWLWFHRDIGDPRLDAATRQVLTLTFAAAARFLRELDADSN